MHAPASTSKFRTRGDATWVAGVVVGALLLAACSSAPSRQHSAGVSAPVLSGRTLDGEPWNLADQRGRWVVVAFQASTCVPCRKEIPELKRLIEEHPDISAVSIGLAESAETFGRFLAPFQVPWPAIADRAGFISDRWDVLSLPVTVVVGPDGRVKRRFTTVTDRSALLQAMKAP